MGDESAAVRLPAIAYIGQQQWEPFHIDLVVERRGVTLPQTFGAPDRSLWEAGYAHEAAESLLADATTLDEALATVRPFIDPLLQGTASGTWDHERGEWVGGADGSTDSSDDT